MTSRSRPLAVGQRVDTPLGRGTIRNLARRVRVVTAVLVHLDGTPDTDRDWRAVSPDAVTQVEEEES